MTATHQRRMEFAKLLPAVENGTVDIALSGITMVPNRNLELPFIGPYNSWIEALPDMDFFKNLEQ